MTTTQTPPVATEAQVTRLNADTLAEARAIAELDRLAAAAADYKRAVHTGEFPGPEHTF